jgi:biopolymer transport protein ExbB
MNNDPSIETQALDLMLRAGARWVLWLLIGLSIIGAAVILERLWFFARARRNRGQVADMFEALRSSGPGPARKALGEAGSLEATVARVCLEHLDDGPAAMQEHIAAVIETDRIHYERGLAFLGTLGNNAPFVGLFGTVMGIVRAFHDLATNTSVGSQAVMAGIAESLVATAIGLLVALPAVASYNILMRHVETAATAATAVGHHLLAYAKSEKRALSPSQPVTREEK